MEAAAGDRLAVEVDEDVGVGLDLKRRQLGRDDHPVDAVEPLAKNRPHRRPQVAFGNVGKDQDVQHSVVDRRVWAQYVAAAGLPPIANGEHEKVALPLEVGAREPSASGADARVAGQARQQIGGAAQRLLHRFGSLHGDLSAEAACRDVQKSAITDAPGVDGRRGARDDEF